MIHHVQIEGGLVIVALKGKIYVDEATVIREKLFRYLEQGYNEFVFHLFDVDYIDSSGLGVLVAVQKRALQAGGGVTIKGLQGEVKKLFELTRLTKVFAIE
ncbi:STAS domain-containing protein [Paenibacillus cymbidii]|uniref:STAS domain-containing protein n=1 Tax=Paenibacillus cymbidii TaxID=1639034 RepID=UPI0010808D7D|nr:STAS domain-containing protein [Paenibacillus cymbidii]